MKSYQINLINSIVLISLGLWSSSDFLVGNNSSWTPLIPVVFGVILLLLNKGLRKESKIQAHIVVFLTILIFTSLFMPLKGAVTRGDSIATIRVGLMLGSSLLAILVFIKSFIDARRKKS